MSHLDNGFRSLTLQRFPATDDVNPLQAWEAADEYLLQQLDDTEIRGPVLILNDAFGALSCALAEHKPYSIGDSYISELATRENLRLNGIDESSVKFLRNAPPINKVMYDNKIHVLKNALGLHTAVSRVQGGKLKAKAEIRVATVFRNAPEPFLRMIVVHELAHLKEKEHNKAFYQLCCHMEPQYHQLEFDTRLWLTQLSLGQDKI